MNPYTHSVMMATKYGGIPEDYLTQNLLMDSSKEAESSNCHRILTHSIWYIRRVMEPIFGQYILTPDGKKINLKDCFENLHIQCDYNGRFLPTLFDYVDLIKDDGGDKDLFEKFFSDNQDILGNNPEVMDFLLSPMFSTGLLKGLFITCNSWTLQFLPKIFKSVDLKKLVKNHTILPSIMFDRVDYNKAEWINNGIKGFPPSFKKIQDKRNNKTKPSDMILDGSPKPTGPIVPWSGFNFVDGSKVLPNDTVIPVDLAKKLKEAISKIPNNSVFIDGGAGKEGGCVQIPVANQKVFYDGSPSLRTGSLDMSQIKGQDKNEEEDNFNKVCEELEISKKSVPIPFEIPKKILGQTKNSLILDDFTFNNSEPFIDGATKQL